MKTKETYSFEILIIDQSGKSEITNTNSLVMGLSYSEKLWNKPQVKNTSKSGSIEDKYLGVQVSVNKAAIPDETNSAFYLTVNCNNIDKGEAFREDLLNHIKEKLGFTNIRLVSDGISEKVSSGIAALILNAENAMRSFLSKYFINDSGLDWWESKAPQHVRDKVNQRKEKVFSDLIDSDIILTDFYDLTDIIRDILPEEDLKSKWEEVVQTREKIQHHNIYRSSDLEKAEKIINNLLSLLSKKEGKIATGKPKASKNTRKAKKAETGTREPSPLGMQSSSPVPSGHKKTNRISEEKKKEEASLVDKNVAIKEEKSEPPKEVNGQAEKKQEPEVRKAQEPKPVVQPEPEATIEKEEKKEEAPAPVQEEKKPAPAPSSNGFSMISETDMLSELKTYESNAAGFVDLKKFVSEVLQPKGYAAGPAFSLARVMEGKGMVQIYDTKDDKGFPVKAIKTQ